MQTYEQIRSNAERIADEAIKARVLRGIEVLNAFDPEWPDYIDPSELLLDSTTQCVLGQVFDRHTPTDDQWAKLAEVNPLMVGRDGIAGIAADGYTKGLAIIDGDVAAHPWDFGFDTEALESYDVLTEAWLVALGQDD